MPEFVLEGYEPQSVLRVFDEITKIPRETGNSLREAWKKGL